jgi:hypothetical protein
MGLSGMQLLQMPQEDGGTGGDINHNGKDVQVGPPSEPGPPPLLPLVEDADDIILESGTLLLVPVPAATAGQSSAAPPAALPTTPSTAAVSASTALLPMWGLSIVEDALRTEIMELHGVERDRYI